MENQKIHGDHVLAYVTEHVVEVDTIDDFDYLEYMVASNSQLYDRLFG